MPDAFVRRAGLPSSASEIARLVVLLETFDENHYERKADRPGYSASPPSASSMRSSWLYFATRSDRDGAPVLICPQPVATARSAMVTSSVSPERCDITAL